MKNFDKLLGFGMLVFAIGFNLWLYRLEPTATIDPNDNAFQYALVDRTNTVWDFTDKYCAEKFPSFFGHWDLRFGICQIGYLVDHWVPNWAEGYNLPYYYSHLPQITIVGSYKILQVLQGLALRNITLFQYYHWIIYLLLCFFPLSVFWSLRVIKLPWLAVGFGALVASQISTDGLHGLDPPSYLWRGYGLTSQLFAQIWFPLAIAYSLRFLENYELRIKNSYFLLAITFLTLTTAGHLGVGIMALLSVIVIGITNIVKESYLVDQMSLRAPPTAGRSNLIMYKIASLIARNDTQIMQHLIKLLLLILVPILILSYWIVPILLDGAYHNISFWDPVWKFNSLGAREVMRLLFNGEIFDFGRFPWLTILAGIGGFAAVTMSLRAQRSNLDSSGIATSSDGHRSPRNDSDHEPQTKNFEPFSILFIFWLFMYFGRTTWGGLLDIIPGMNEFHQHRFVDGVHMAGLFLIPIGAHYLIVFLTNLVNKIFKKFNYHLSYLIIGLLGYWVIGLLIIPQTMKYAKFNDELILRANVNHAKVKDDEELLFQTLRSLPSGRVYAGRGGGWGKDFRIAETPWYMNLTTYGVPSVLWLPETWSPNSDIEQYFSEEQLKDYDLFGIRYVVAPVNQKPQPFWKPIKEAETWKLYSVIPETSPVIPAQAGIQSHGSPSGVGDEGYIVGYFTTGILPAVISSSKTDYINLVRLWIQSDYPKQKLFPEIRLTKDFVTTPLPHFKMLDESRYETRDGKIYGLFGAIPKYQIQDTQKINNLIFNPDSEDNIGDMIFTANVEVKEPCPECLVILKQSAHPNWKAYIDGKRVQTLIVFPFYSAVKLETPGIYKITFKYEPSGLKMFLIGVVLLSVIIMSLRAISKAISSIIRLLRLRQLADPRNDT